MIKPKFFHIIFLILVFALSCKNKNNQKSDLPEEDTVITTQNNNQENRKQDTTTIKINPDLETIKQLPRKTPNISFSKSELEDIYEKSKFPVKDEKYLNSNYNPATDYRYLEAISLNDNKLLLIGYMEQSEYGNIPNFYFIEIDSSGNLLYKGDIMNNYDPIDEFIFDSVKVIKKNNKFYFVQITSDVNLNVPVDDIDVSDSIKFLLKNIFDTTLLAGKNSKSIDRTLKKGTFTGTWGDDSMKMIVEDATGKIIFTNTAKQYKYTRTDFDGADNNNMFFVIDENNDTLGGILYFMFQGNNIYGVFKENNTNENITIKAKAIK